MWFQNMSRQNTFSDKMSRQNGNCSGETWQMPVQPGDQGEHCCGGTGGQQVPPDKTAANGSSAGVCDVPAKRTAPARACGGVDTPRVGNKITGD